MILNVEFLSMQMGTKLFHVINDISDTDKLQTELNTFTLSCSNNKFDLNTNKHKKQVITRKSSFSDNLLN